MFPKPFNYTTSIHLASFLSGTHFNILAPTITEKPMSNFQLHHFPVMCKIWPHLHSFLSAAFFTWPLGYRSPSFSYLIVSVNFVDSSSSNPTVRFKLTSKGFSLLYTTILLFHLVPGFFRLAILRQLQIFVFWAEVPYKLQTDVAR